MVLVIFGLFLGFSVNQNLNYVDCQAEQFKGEACKVSKYLKEKGGK